MNSMSSDEIFRTGKLEGSVAACEGEGFEQPLQPHLSHFAWVQITNARGAGSELWSLL